MTTETLERDAPEVVETPRGPLHKPPGRGRQALALLLAFAGGPAIGWVMGQVPGDLSETARGLLYVPYVLVFFLGYAAWLARLKVIVFQGLGMSFLKALFTLVIRRKKPESLADVLPTREKLFEIAVKAQLAGNAFRRVGWLLGAAAGLVAALLDSAMGGAARFVLVAATTVAWGYALSYLARRGYLPTPEEG